MSSTRVSSSEILAVALLFTPAALAVVAGIAVVAAGTTVVAGHIEERQRRRKEEERQAEYRRKLEEKERQCKLEEDRQRQVEEIKRQRQREEERQRQIEEERRRQAEEAKRQRQMAEAHRQLVEQTWRQTRQMLRKEIDQVRSAPERQNLTALLKGLTPVWRQAMLNNNTAAAEKALAELRQKIFFARTDEKMLDSRRDDLSQLLTKLGAEAPSGFAPELEALRKDSNSENSNLSIEEQTKRIEALKAKARKLASEIAQANALSLDDLVEETVFIPEPADNKQSKEDGDAAGVALVADICDFGGRVAFFDEHEAERLKPLVLEAKQGTTMTRLKLIRGEIKTIYGHLRECAVLTDMFKRDLRDFLPPMRKAQGTEQLCRRMEELLEASNVSRDAYDESQVPPAKPGACICEPLKAAESWAA